MSGLCHQEENKEDYPRNSMSATISNCHIGLRQMRNTTEEVGGWGPHKPPCLENKALTSSGLFLTTHSPHHGRTRR